VPVEEGAGRGGFAVRVGPAVARVPPLGAVPAGDGEVLGAASGVTAAVPGVAGRAVLAAFADFTAFAAFGVPAGFGFAVAVAFGVPLVAGFGTAAEVPAPGSAPRVPDAPAAGFVLPAVFGAAFAWEPAACAGAPETSAVRVRPAERPAVSPEPPEDVSAAAAAPPAPRTASPARAAPAPIRRGLRCFPRSAGRGNAMGRRSFR
jgi:hypothetical protein